MLGIGKLISLLEKIAENQNETNSRLLGCQIKLDMLIEQNTIPEVQAEPKSSPFMDKDGLYNYQFYKKNRVKREDGE